MRYNMNLIGFFCLAWALLACDQDEGKITLVFLSRIMVRYWPFPVRKDMGGMPQVAERVKYIK